MRLYVLDDVVDPVSGEVLRVENAQIVERSGPAVAKCRNWCGYRGRPPAEVSDDACRTCRDLWIVSGDLKGSERYRIFEGVPRLAPSRVGCDARQGRTRSRTRESFGYEWEHFNRILREYPQEASNYFRIVADHLFEDAVVLDAGCGIGRWARQVANRGVRRLYAVDFSRAIDRAAAILTDQENTHCVQADVCQLPFRAATFDFVYCLGVLHHLAEPDEGMRDVTRVLRPQGALLVYLYYSLENRPRFFRWLLTVVSSIRRLTVRLPKPIMYGLAWVIALMAYWPLARLAAALERLGLGRFVGNLPLSHYRGCSVRLMAGDAFDRFATPIEWRYSRSAIRAWLARYGFEVKFSDATPYWVGLATRPPQS